jgi:hypothetical protein
VWLTTWEDFDTTMVGISNRDSVTDTDFQRILEETLQFLVVLQKAKI